MRERALVSLLGLALLAAACADRSPLSVLELPEAASREQAPDPPSHLDCTLVGQGLVLEGSPHWFPGRFGFSHGHIEGPALTPQGSWFYRGLEGDEIVLTEPLELGCRLNGALHARVLGWGTFNGQLAYIVLDIEDVQPVNGLIASRFFSPSRWEDGFLDFSDLAEASRWRLPPDGSYPIMIPDRLPVLVGNAGNQQAWITFTLPDTPDLVRCIYRGGASVPNPIDPEDIERGRHYEFDRCERYEAVTGVWETDPEWIPWTRLPPESSTRSVTSARLRVQNGSSHFPEKGEAETRVLARLSRPSDRFMIEALLAPAFEIVYWFYGDAGAGDASIWRPI